jgi:hypothetical protein
MTSLYSAQRRYSALPPLSLEAGSFVHLVALHTLVSQGYDPVLLESYHDYHEKVENLIELVRHYLCV